MTSPTRPTKSSGSTTSGTNHLTERCRRNICSFCLVDEADSILIEEARTPLIISRSVDAPAQKFSTAQKIASALEQGVHYTVSEKDQPVVPTDKGFVDCDRIPWASMFNSRDP